MGEYRTSSHAVFDIKYHIVCITKYRYKILPGRVAERAPRPAPTDLSEQGRGDRARRGVAGSHSHAGVVSAEHGAGETGAIPERGGRRADCRTNFGEFRKRHWGQHLWARYFRASLGVVDEDTIKKYIESQKWEDEDQGFKITAPSEP
jgi:putative transposase